MPANVEKLLSRDVLREVIARQLRAIDPLLIAAKDANADVRRQALFAIGQIDPARGKDAAIEALKDKDAEVRRMAAHLLGRLASERD